MIDVVLVGSGSIRGTELGPSITLSELKKVYPYDGSLYLVKVTGTQLKQIFTYFMRPENRIPGESNYFQVNKGVEAVYNDADKKLESLKIKGKVVEDDSQYTLCLQEYHVKNSVESLNIKAEELKKLGNEKVLTTSSQDVLEEYFGSHQNLNSHVEGRLVQK